MNISPEWIIRIVLIIVCFGFIIICSCQDDEKFQRKLDEIRKTKTETDPDISDSTASVLAFLILAVVVGSPLFMVGSLLADADEIGIGPALLLIGIITIAGVSGWKDSGASNAAPPPPPKPPAYVDKNWQHSPGGIETQKFEGGYNGELNKEFEQK